jgi:OPA family glycerol-3-phosphate transporter-like MFS transporter
MRTIDIEPNSARRRAQWRMLLATMFCYLFYYTGRQTFGFAIPGIQEELKLSKAQLGWISAGLLWSYAIGQSINGNLGDKFGGRQMMSLGAIISCILNWTVSFGTSFFSLLVPWAANGYAQSMGWAPGSRVLSNWWGQKERGMVYGAYVFAAGLSSVLAFVTSTLILEYELGWRWIFRLPVLLLLFGGIIYYLVARDRPEELGFPPPTEPATEPTTTVAAASGPFSSSWDRYRHSLSNARFLIACVAIGCQNLARYGLLIWVPVHFLGESWQTSSTKWISVALPVGMAAGAITNGYLSDRLFASNRSWAIASFMASAACCSIMLYLIPRESATAIPLIFLTGFFAYGPQSAFWALCPDLLGKECAGTGTGIMNTFAYGFAGCGEPLIGWLIDGTGETSIIFAIVAVCCVVSAIISLFIRR